MLNECEKCSNFKLDRNYKKMKKILCIDDDYGDLVIISTILASLGFKTDRAETYKTALEFLKDNDYAMIIVDYRLPIVPGIEIYKQLKKITTTPIFISSGHYYEDIEKNLLAENISENYFISKESLITSLRRAVEYARI